MSKPSLPKEFEVVRNAARHAISPIKPADASTQTPNPDFLFDAKRSDAGRSLPPYYLVYFLLVELLGFKNLVQFEKVAWSIPIDLNGVAYIIEHDLPLKFHPAAIRASADFTSSGASGATCDRRSWSGLRRRSHVAERLAA